MATYDWTGTDIIPNGSGSAVRADLNDALLALFSQNSSATAPPETVAYMTWADTSTGLYKIRNAANSGWITLYQLDGEWTTIALENGTAAAPSLYFKDSGTDTGFYSPGADQVAIATAGVQRVNFNGATEVVFNDGGADVDFRIEGDTEPNLFKVDAGTDQVQVANLNGGPLAGTRNRIINGDMRIDQRNNGASVTATTGVSYVLDRWTTQWSATSKFSVQQNAGSVTPPAGFKNYQGLTSLSAYSIAATDFFGTAQTIEGFNAEDLDWGTASAKTVTLSFWVRSSLTGTFGGSIRNYAANYSYPFTYSIGAANTWTYISITISGPTAGTWSTGTAGWGSVIFGIGVGSTYSGTAGSWSGSNFLSATGATSVVGTNGATFYITGVQLEAGTVATPFERRSYGQELALCQRYYEETAVYWIGDVTNATTYGAQFNFCVEKRATPTMTSISQGGAANGSMGTRTPVASGGRKGGSTTAYASATISAAGFSDSYAASAEL